MIRSVPVSTQGNATRLGRLRDVTVQDTSSFGCLSWPACVAGGTLCPDPNGFGASLNPCCHFTPPDGICPDSVPADGGGIVSSFLSSATSSSSSAMVLLAIAAVAILGIAVVKR